MLIEDLKRYCPGAIPMHMPGHKRNTLLSPYLRDLGAAWDITEIDGFDDLHAPQGILLASMRRAARLWGSEESAYLVNGSTGGLLAAVYALAGDGGEAIVARNCHKSVYHALEITGLSPHFLKPAADENGMCGRIAPESVACALAQVPKARFILVTSPTYEGVISDLAAICRLAHEKNVPVIVDEAHGAHLGLHGVFPAGAVQAGADIVVQSLHKTLPSLTQTAIAHLSGPRVDRRAFGHALDIFQTSSPSYLLMASMDGCVRLMEEQGEGLLKGWLGALEEFYQEIRSLRALRVERRPDRDPSKIVIDTSRAGLSGFALSRLLREEFHIELEMALPRYALAMTGLGDTPASLAALRLALTAIDNRLSPLAPPEAPCLSALPQALLPPRQALSAPSRPVEVLRAAGHISAEYAWAYPPGIPLLVPGEQIPDDFPALWNALIQSGAKTLTTRGDPAHISVLIGS